MQTRPTTNIQDIKTRQIIHLDHPWLREAFIKNMRTEERKTKGDQWGKLGCTWQEYFYEDGFSGLKYEPYHVRNFLSNKNYTHVDWFATPTAITSLADSLETPPALGISVGLSSHLTPKQEQQLAEQRNIHHLTGSALDPAIHAQMLDVLDGNTIDVFSARLKGGYKLLPMKAESASYLYYYRIINFLYRHISPNGFMFFETPHSVRGEDFMKWQTLAINQWMARLDSHGIDVDHTGNALVIRKHPEINTLPQLDLFDELDGYGSASPQLQTLGSGLINMPISVDDQLALLEKNL